MEELPLTHGTPCNETKQKELATKWLALNVNEHTEKKGGLTYLSWAWAWAEVLKEDPTANYEVEWFDGKPYCKDEQLGYMVFTKVTIHGLTRKMWLPVMDGANKTMKDIEYSYTTKYGEKTVEAATMFDINKAIMRCLVKNLAMFGLGMYIYAGEDLPQNNDEPEPVEKCTAEQIEEMRALKINEVNVCKAYGVAKIEDLSKVQADMAITKKLTQNGGENGNN